MWRIAILAVAFTCLLPRAALAQPSPYSLMDRPTLATRFGLDSQIGFHSTGPFKAKTLRLDLHGQYMLRRFGVFFAIPLSFMSASNDAAPLAGDNDEFAIGNIEVAGLYALRLRQFSLLGRVGFTVPTADNDPLGDPNQSPSQAANLRAGLVRVTDLIYTLPKAGALRLSLSALFGGGRNAAIGRIDVGADIPLSKPQDEPDRDPFLRANVGAGYRVDDFVFMGEFTSLFGQSAFGPQDFTFYAMGISARWIRSRWQPSIGVAFPFGDVKDFGLDFGFMVGIQHAGGF
jgi:hypothetical protein